MKKVLSELLQRAAGWPEIAQAELVESMLRAGKIATDDEIAAVFDRFRRA